MSKETIKAVKFADGKTCNDPGCYLHTVNPCEGCGRIRCKGIVYEEIETGYKKTETKLVGMKMTLKDGSEKVVKAGSDIDFGVASRKCAGKCAAEKKMDKEHADAMLWGKPTKISIGARIHTWFRKFLKF